MAARSYTDALWFIWLGALGFGWVLQAPVLSAAPSDLVLDDLQEALERGDIDADAYEQLLGLFRTRVSTDTAAAPRSDEPIDTRDFDSLLSLPIVAPGGRSRAAWEVGVPLRGVAGRRDWLLVAPSVRHAGGHWEFARTGAGEWRVYRGYAWWQSRRLSLAGGSFDLRWIDGLVVGVAPAFIGRRDTFAGSLVQPDRGRFNGLACDLSGLDTRASVIVSQRTDSSLSFRVYGLRVQRQVRNVELSAAWVRQSLARMGRDSRFNTSVSGFEASRMSSRGLAQFALAFTPHDWAAQGRFDFDAGAAYRAGLAVWRVGQKFRNPLAEGSAEADREPVYYPELDRTIASAATGERGGELRLRFGRQRGRGDITLRYWREQPSRGASMRAVAGIEPGAFGGGRWRFEWRVWRRPSADLQATSRHEWTVRTRGRRLYALARLRAVHGNWAPFGRLGGRCEVGFGPFVEEGRQTLVVACNDYDFAARSSAHLTIRSSQTLRVSRRSDATLQLSWRSSYCAHPAALVLRITTRVTL
jgi:hypothetical protein